jgi:hypothetical protein
MTLSVRLLVGALLIMPSAVVAEQAQPLVAKQVKQKDPNRVICRDMEATGSRLNRRRECHTAGEWEEIRLNDRRALERVQNGRSKNE